MRNNLLGGAELTRAAPVASAAPEKGDLAGKAVASPAASSCRGAVLVPGRRAVHQICAFTLDCAQVPLCSSTVYPQYIPAPARPAENLPSWDMPSRGHVPTPALGTLVQHCAGVTRAAAPTAALPEVSALKNLKKGWVFFFPQGCSAAAAHPDLGWVMLSCWVGDLHCAGPAVSAWTGMKGPEVPSAKTLNEPLMNNFFFPFLLSLF